MEGHGKQIEKAAIVSDRYDVSRADILVVVRHNLRAGRASSFNASQFRRLTRSSLTCRVASFARLHPLGK